MAEDHETERYERFDELRKLSKEAQSLAYCPYSKFRVGCALLTSDNKIYMGANVENASYGAAICAERVAITRAVMDGHKSFKAIAVAGDTKTPLSPCGICRQFIREFSSDMPVHMFGTEGQKTLTMAELLPMSFGPEALN